MIQYDKNHRQACFIIILLQRKSSDYASTEGFYSCGHSQSEMSHEHGYDSQLLQSYGYLKFKISILCRKSMSFMHLTSFKIGWWLSLLFALHVPYFTYNHHTWKSRGSEVWWLWWSILLTATTNLLVRHSFRYSICWLKYGLPGHADIHQVVIFCVVQIMCNIYF
jgi:hypothetical protein